VGHFSTPVDTVTTMDWEALPFYKKLGYQIEYVREGYENASRQFLLRKNLMNESSPNQKTNFIQD
jgi:hypothetical protein